ncbi:MAG TPA: ABC transporter permease [Actinoallomurus sp.]|nr:ABC transporter permease [Actinoallomurus sp.]
MTAGTTTASIPGVRRGARPFGRSGASGIALRWAVFAVAVGLWQLATYVAVPEDDKLFFPAPTVIFSRMYHLWLTGPANHVFLTSAATDNILPSLERMLGGWLLAVVVGVALGVLLGRSRRMLDYVDPLIQFGRAIPSPTLIPVFIVLFKLGTTMRLAVIVFGVIWPILLNAIDGARTVEPLQLETAKVFALTRFQRLRMIIIPSAAPKIFAGLRVSLSMSIILMVISEMIGGTDGIGYTLYTAKDSFELPDMWSAIVLLGIIGYTFNSLLLWVEGRALAWHRGARRVEE